MGSLVDAEVKRFSPIFESESPSNRYREPALSDEPCVMAEDIVAMNHPLFPSRGPNTEAAFVEVTEAHDPARVAVDDLPKMRREPHRLVFIDETGTNTKMTRLRGRCLKGRRLKAKAPFGH